MVGRQWSWQLRLGAALALVVILAAVFAPVLAPHDPLRGDLRGAYLLPGGTVIVDVGGSTLTQGWGGGSHSELMAVCSLVQSLTMNFREAQRVRIVLNGSSTETLGGHISLAHSLPPPAPARDPCIALTKR